MTHPTVSSAPGVTRQVLAHTPDLMVVAFRFDTGAEGAVHDHAHVQATYVQSGCFSFVLGQTRHELRAGDSLIVPASTSHGCTCLAAGTLIDTFAPRRDDFL